MKTRHLTTIAITALMLTAAFATRAAAQRTYAIVAAVSNYNGSDHDLKQSTKDAKRIAALYRTKGAVATLLTGSNASKDTIVSYIRKVASVIRPDDDMVFYFSGHGTKNAALLTYDSLEHNTTSTCLLHYSDLIDQLDSCQCRRVVCFIDACYSGTAIDNMKEWRNQRQTNNKFVIFLSSRDTEFSFESGTKGSQVGGFFSQGVLDGLCGKCDTDGDHRVTVKELHTYINGNVNKLMKHSQHSQHTQLVTSAPLLNEVLMDWNDTQP